LPSEEVEDMFDSILIATDGSAHGDRALDLARSLLSGQSARLTVVHVIELVGGKGGVYPRAADEDLRRKSIEAQVNELQKAGVTANLLTPTVRLGGPAHAIAEAADTVNADLIVVGTRGHSLISKVVLGSVSMRLLQVAQCPVLVVPLPDEREGAASPADLWRQAPSGEVTPASPIEE
jgi:nucleotide-binding universal stress UspA family protein